MGWSRWVDPSILCDALSAKKKKKQKRPCDSAGECRPPLQCLSQFNLQREEKDQLSSARVYCIPFCGRMDRYL